MQTIVEAENDKSIFQLVPWMEEEALLEHLARCRKGDDPRYLILDLVVGTYSPQRLVAMATEAGHGAVLGYLSDLARQALPQENDPSSLDAMINAAQPAKEWERLAVDWPHSFDAILRDRADKTNTRWRVYALMDVQYISEWFELYSNELRQAQHIDK